MHSEFEGHLDFVKGDDARNWDKQFGIRHYAGVVSYSVLGFVDKNRDTQQDVFFDSLAKSKSSFIHELCEFKVIFIPNLANSCKMLHRNLERKVSDIVSYIFTGYADSSSATWLRFN